MQVLTMLTVRDRDRLALGLLLVACIAASALAWGRMYDPVLDGGWYLQVSARVAQGETLYADVLWMYGPLPVWLLAALFRAVGMDATLLLWLQHGLAVANALLAYGVARSLLPPRWALAGVAAGLCAGWWGGWVGHAFAYTGAVPLGATLGLGCVAALVSWQRSRHLRWSALAGLAAGGALLRKPEFALATLGAGVSVLGWQALSSRGRRCRRWLPLATFVLAAGAVAGSGYGLLLARAPWSAIWAGLSGYDQDTILLTTWPPWGHPRSWAAMVGGLGLWVAAASAWLAGNFTAHWQRRRAVLTVAGGVALAVTGAAASGLAAALWAGPVAAYEAGVRLLWAPATLVSAGGLAWLGLRRARTARMGTPTEPVEGALALLLLYTLLADARSMLHPLGTFHFAFLHTLWPVVLWALTVGLPRLAGQPQPGRNTRRLLVALLVCYALGGLGWSATFISRMDTWLVSSRGQMRYDARAPRRHAWNALLATIVAHSAPDAPIAILGHEPGFYFWSVRPNPLAHDTLLPGLRTGPEDGRALFERLSASRPGLVIVPRGVTVGAGWFWDLPEGRQAYANLAPVWRWLADDYAWAMRVGNDTWGYDIYVPRGAGL